VETIPSIIQRHNSLNFYNDIASPVRQFCKLRSMEDDIYYSACKAELLRVAIYLRGGLIYHNLSAHEYTKLFAIILKVYDRNRHEIYSVLATGPYLLRCSASFGTSKLFSIFHRNMLACIGQHSYLTISFIVF
jgi:hypothetical protein